VSNAALTLHQARGHAASLRASPQSAPLASTDIASRSFGLANSYGVMQAQYAQDVLRDKSTSQIAWIGAFQVRTRAWTAPQSHC
jgi:hypothetical protein